MTATQSIDLPGWMAEQLSQASPDLLRTMLQTFAEALMSADADAVCGAGYGQRNPNGLTPATVTAPRLGHPRRVDRSGDPEAAGGKLLPRLAVGAAPTEPSPPLCRWWRPPTCWRLDTADGEAGRATSASPG